MPIDSYSQGWAKSPGCKYMPPPLLLLRRVHQLFDTTIDLRIQTNMANPISFLVDWVRVRAIDHFGLLEPQSRFGHKVLKN